MEPANDDTSRAAAPGPALDADQLREVLTLLPDSDSVELKVTVPEAGRRHVMDRLGMDPMRAQLRQVAYFDTDDLRLDRAGVVVRARRVQGKNADCVVKLRPVVPAALGPELRGARGFGVEVDAMPGGFVCSASLRSSAEDAAVREVLLGRGTIADLLSKRQRTLLAARAPDDVALDDLRVLGPLNILKLKFTADGYPRPRVAELWFYPDGSQVLELSAKCPPAEAFTAAAETKAFLSERGVDLTAPQQTKTRTALQMLTS